MNTDKQPNGNEREIGERFMMDGIEYVCRPVLENSCKGCVFYYEDESECLDWSNDLGRCTGGLRPDGINVIYQRITDDI